MMCEIPLTLEQKKFASDHHDLVYKFLHDRHLPIDEFYDIVIFGYLNAVKSYLSKTDIHTYTFATLGWKLMTQSLTDHYKEQRCQKRNAEEFRLHAMSCTDDLPFEDALPASDNYMQQLEFTLLLHDLAKRVSKQQMDIVRMRSSGYNLHDIAACQNTSTKRIRKLLEEVRCVLMEICHE